MEDYGDLSGEVMFSVFLYETGKSAVDVFFCGVDLPDYAGYSGAYFFYEDMEFF